MIRTGLFHSIKAVSKGGLFALEFETPFNKNDLVRFKDNYGRQSKPYEGKKFTKKIDSNFIKFKRPTLEKNQLFKIPDKLAWKNKNGGPVLQSQIQLPA